MSLSSVAAEVRSIVVSLGQEASTTARNAVTRIDERRFIESSKLQEIQFMNPKRYVDIF